MDSFRFTIYVYNNSKNVLTVLHTTPTYFTVCACVPRPRPEALTSDVHFFFFLSGLTSVAFLVA